MNLPPVLRILPVVNSQRVADSLSPCDLLFRTRSPELPGFYRHLLLLGKSKGGLTNGGLSPKFSEKIGGKSFLENRAFSGQIGAISGLVGAFSGPIGTNSSAPHSHGGRAEIALKGPFLARLAPFGLSPPLLSPRLDFPDPCLWLEVRSQL